MKLSTIIKGSVCVLGLVGVSNFFAAPAKADQAAARGAVTIVRPSGSSISISGEVVAAPGADFSDVKVEFTGSDPGTNQETLTDLTVTPTAGSGTAADNSTIEGAIATLISGATINGIEDLAALVRAASSGGLE